MARLISVRDVREGLYRAAGGPGGAGSGEASSALLGQWFHEAFAALIGTDPCLSLETALAESRDDYEEQCPWTSGRSAAPNGAASPACRAGSTNEEMLTFASMPTGIRQQRDLEIENIAVTLRLAPTPMSSIDTAQ